MQRLICVALRFLSVLALPNWAVARTDFAPCDTTFLNLSICPGQSVFIAGNIYDAQNTSGTTILPEASWDGTDSVVVVNLAVRPPVINHISAAYCNNQALLINGHIYDATNPSGTELLPGAASGGCDSLIVVDLTFLTEATYHLEQTICTGDTVWVNNLPYDQHYYLGMETIEGGATNGCDSIVLVDLTVLPTPTDTLYQLLCPYETLRINGSEYDMNRPTGTEILSNAATNGCDSIVFVQLTFSSPPATSAFLGPDQLVGVGDSTCVVISTDLAVESIDWEPAQTCTTSDCSSICLWATQHQSLIATITDQYQCSYSDTLRIIVSFERPIYVPNVFSPDAPSPNNRFSIFPGTAVTQVNWLVLHDRWGSLVYEARNFIPADGQQGWDGTIQGQTAPLGVYAYAFEVLFPDGIKEVRSGLITLLR
jgi:hypothetical protein